MAQDDNQELTQEVLESFARTSDPRLKEIVLSLVRHLHSFVRDVDLSFSEWQRAIDFLTRTGQKCTDVRQEFILLSDILGVSMLVDAINHREREGATETTVLGPFYLGEHREAAHGADISDSHAGELLFVKGEVEDVDGRPLPGAQIDVWHADADGLYDSQKPGYGLEKPDHRARFVSGPKGEFFFRTVLPASYPIPTDGPVGELLAAARRHPMRPAHVHFWVRAPGHEDLVTHVFVEGDEYIRSDAVFGVKDALISRVSLHQESTLPDGSPASAPWRQMTYTFRMQTARAAAAA